MARIKTAIDLLWVRPNQVGGIEAYIRNLLNGFLLLEDEYEFYLMVSRDNAESFARYEKDSRFHLTICNIMSANVSKRILWQNLHLGKEIIKMGIRTCFEPYYCKPFLGTNGISFITTIHDLQAIHYPEYFSKLKVLWMRVSWYNSVKTSKVVVAISDYVKGDIIEHYKDSSDKILSIHNPITIDPDKIASADYIEGKYNIKRQEFFFTVSSLLPHKNLKTLLYVIRKIKDEEIKLPNRLIISGIGGKSKDEIQGTIQNLGLEENITLTPFISEEERNALYKNCRAFLFPSIFEGFGMPPVEAMLFGTPVVTTKMTSIPEVTQGKANYVDDPFNVDQWIEEIRKAEYRELDFSVYDLKVIAGEYFAAIAATANKEV